MLEEKEEKEEKEAPAPAVLEVVLAHARAGEAGAFAGAFSSFSSSSPARSSPAPAPVLAHAPASPARSSPAPAPLAHAPLPAHAHARVQEAAEAVSASHEAAADTGSTSLSLQQVLAAGRSTSLQEAAEAVVSSHQAGAQVQQSGAGEAGVAQDMRDWIVPDSEDEGEAAWQHREVQVHMQEVAVSQVHAGGETESARRCGGVEAERVEEERVRGEDGERAEGVHDDSHVLLSQLLLLMSRCEEEEEAEEAGVRCGNGARLVAAAVAAEEARRKERAAAETSREDVLSLTSRVVHGKRLRQDREDELDAGSCSAQCRRAPRVSCGCVSGNGGGADGYAEVEAGGADVSYKWEGKTREGRWRRKEVGK